MHICERSKRILFVRDSDFTLSSSQYWLSEAIFSKLIGEILDGDRGYVRAYVLFYCVETRKRATQTSLFAIADYFEKDYFESFRDFS